MHKKESKSAILVTKNGRTIKLFKCWLYDGTSHGKIEIPFKDKNGDKIKVIKEYKATKDKVCMVMFIEAVIKYWPKYDPEKHDMFTSYGHNHEIEKKKVRKK